MNLKTDLRDKIATAIHTALQYYGDMNQIRSEDTGYAISDRILEILPPFPGVVPVHALFETKDGRITGTASVPVKRVELQDDGAVTVTLDYWPPHTPIAPAESHYLKAPDPKLGDLRMSEMTPEQQDDALELWLRKNIGQYRHETHRHLTFLLDRLANTRFEALQHIAAEAAKPDPHMEQLLMALGDSGCIVTRNADGDYTVYNARAADMKNRLNNETVNLKRELENVNAAFDTAMRTTNWIQDEYNNPGFELTNVLGLQRGEVAQQLVAHLRKVVADYREMVDNKQRTIDATIQERNGLRQRNDNQSETIASMIREKVELEKSHEELANAKHDLENEVAKLREDLVAERQRPLPPGWTLDDPEADGTDNAHPAWWRAYDSACRIMCAKIEDILTGKDTGDGVSNPPWEPVRRKLIEMVEKHDEKHDKLIELEKERDKLIDWYEESKSSGEKKDIEIEKLKRDLKGVVSGDIPTLGADIEIGVASTCVLGQDLDLIGIWEEFKRENPRKSSAFDAIVYAVRWVRKHDADVGVMPALNRKLSDQLKQAWEVFIRENVVLTAEFYKTHKALKFGLDWFNKNSQYQIAGRREAWALSMPEQMIRHYLPEVGTNFPALFNEVDAKRMANVPYNARKLLIVAYDITEK